MKRVRGEFPFQDYWVYKPVMNSSEGRRSIVLVHIQSGEKTSTSYPRYLMSVKLRRRLKKCEFVDHIDEDKENDSLINLQVLSREENNLKSLAHRKVQKFWVTLSCPNCGKIFERERRQTHLAKKGVFTGCSRKCSGRVRSLLAHGKLKLQEVTKNNVLKEFKKDSY